MMRSLVVELGDNGVELLEGEAFVGGGLLVDVSGVDELKKVVVVDGADKLRDGGKVEVAQKDGVAVKELML